MDKKEAWVLDGDDWQKATLVARNKSNIRTATDGELDSAKLSKRIHLRLVELRAILDDAVWTSRFDDYGNIKDLFFDLPASGSRRWIIREKLLSPSTPNSNASPTLDSYQGGHGVHPQSRPSLISSAGVEWLRAWIERFTEFSDKHSMTDKQRDLFDRWLSNLSNKDRRAWWGKKILSERAMQMLEKFDVDYGKDYRRWQKCKDGHRVYECDCQHP